MLRISTIILLLALPLAQLSAGRIFGDLKIGDKAVAEGVKITVTAPIKPAEPGKQAATPAIADTAATDKFGAYRLTVKEEGKCILTVHIDKQSPTLEVYSYANATRYDLVLEKNKEGKYSVRRK